MHKGHVTGESSEEKLLCMSAYDESYRDSTQAGANESDRYTKMSCGGDSFPEQYTRCDIEKLRSFGSCFMKHELKTAEFHPTYFMRFVSACIYFY